MELSEYAKQLRELADIIEERGKKYCVKVFPGGSGYFNIDQANGNYSIQNEFPLDHYQTEFTNDEIEDLKTNPALKAINWDEVKLIPVD